MTEKPVKAQLIQLLEEACLETSRLVESLDDAHKQAQGKIDHWAVKDILVHIGYWNEIDAEKLAAFRQGEKVEDSDEALAVNDRVFEECKDCTFEEAFERVAAAYGSLTAEIELLSEEDLHNTDKYAWTRGRPLSAYIFGGAYSHVLVHLAQFQVEMGRMDEGRRLFERLAETMVALDDSPRSRGAAAYNLACFYALAGQSEKAIELLGTALPLSPSLVEWSKEDTDLVSLHDLPAYKALYN